MKSAENQGNITFRIQKMTWKCGQYVGLIGRLNLWNFDDHNIISGTESKMENAYSHYFFFLNFMRFFS